MRRRGGGSIINFGSMTWHASEGGYPAYATCKAAVEGLTRSLARDLGPDRIRVNTIIPGWVMTERQMRLWLDAEGEAEIARRQCLKDKLQPDDVARMALFLAADDFADVHGAELHRRRRLDLITLRQQRTKNMH